VPSRLTAAPRRPIPPIKRIEPRGHRRADQQIVVAAAGRDAPAQQLAWSGEDLVGACCQLMTIDLGAVALRPSRWRTGSRHGSSSPTVMQILVYADGKADVAPAKVALLGTFGLRRDELL
jgi:hypothetical protein